MARLQNLSSSTGHFNNSARAPRGRSRSAGQVLAAALLVAAAGCSPPPAESPTLPRLPASADVPTLAEQNAEFAVDMLRALDKSEKGNVFFSPHSISTALAMVWAGARNQTEDVIARTMHWTSAPDATHDAFASLANSLVPPKAESGETTYEWTSANRLWTSIRVLDAFNQRLVDSYGSDAHKIDFGDRTSAAKEINAWADRWTRGHIQEIVKPDDLRDLRLMLTNAVYFKGTWDEPFLADATSKEDFHAAGGTTVVVDMMHAQRSVRSAQANGYRAVSLPYQGGVSCMFILPDAGAMEQVISGLSAADLANSRQHMQLVEARLAIPKLSIKTRFSAKEHLAAMGMENAFGPLADFSGISTAEPLAISDVLHAATVDMDEVGTVATAVTAIGVRVTSALPTEAIEFRLDRPYIFAIIHDKTGEVLFLGRINNPAEGS